MSIYRKNEGGVLKTITKPITQRWNDRIFQTIHSVSGGEDYYDIEPAALKYILGLRNFTEYQLYIAETNTTKFVNIRFNGQSLRLECMTEEMVIGGLLGKTHCYTLDTTTGKIWVDNLVELQLVRQDTLALDGRVTTLEEKTTSIYDFKGSVLFENLPTTGQVTGDTYNILNNFTLGGEDYLAGTNVAWNGSVWDALGSHIPDGNEVQYSLGVSVNEKIDSKVDKTSIVDNLTTDDATKVLSAKQGKVLQDTKEALANKKSVINDSETEYSNSKGIIEYTSLNVKNHFVNAFMEDTNSDGLADNISLLFRTITPTITDGYQKAYSNGFVQQIGFYQDLSEKLIIGHKYYIGIDYKSNKESAWTYRVQGSDGSSYPSIYAQTTMTPFVYTATIEVNRLLFTLNHNTATNIPDTYYLEIGKPTIIDLTELYGVGNEKTALVFNAIFSSYIGLFNGIKVLNSMDFTKKDTYYTSRTTRNKKWVVVGDSLTQVNTRANARYYDYVSDELSLQVINMGLGGTGYYKDYLSNEPFYERILDVDTTADVVTIFGSGNDIGATSLGDVTDTEPTTLCGAINKTIDNYISIMNGANKITPLGIITPTAWQGYEPTTPNNAMELYCNAIVEICKRRAIPCLDLYHTSNLRPDDAVFRTLAYSKDDGNGVHPDENGHRIIASKIREFVKTLI